MGTMRIRNAADADHAALAALLARAYAPVLEAMAPQHAAAFRSALAATVGRYAETGTWFVAEGGDSLIGAVAYFAPHAVAHRHFQDDWSHVQLLGVDPDHTQRGVGSALMRRCLAAAREAGTALALQTSELMAPARRLYAALGFVLERPLEPAFGHPTYLYIHREA